MVQYPFSIEIEKAFKQQEVLLKQLNNSALKSLPALSNIAAKSVLETAVSKIDISPAITALNGLKTVSLSGITVTIPQLTIACTNILQSARVSTALQNILADLPSIETLPEDQCKEAIDECSSLCDSIIDDAKQQITTEQFDELKDAMNSFKTEPVKNGSVSLRHKLYKIIAATGIIIEIGANIYGFFSDAALNQKLDNIERNQQQINLQLEKLNEAMNSEPDSQGIHPDTER